MRQLAKDYYSPSACIYHYLHMARGNFREYLQDDIVWVKKYFYVLRPILAMNWIEKGWGIAPTDFTVLVDKLPLAPDVRDSIYQLRNSKLAGDELDRGPKIPEISIYIESELKRWEIAEIDASSPRHHIDRLDEFFRNSLEEVWKLNNS